MRGIRWAALGAAALCCMPAIPLGLVAGMCWLFEYRQTSGQP